MPDNVVSTLLEDEALVGSSQSAEKCDALLSELDIFEAGSTVNGDTGGVGDDELRLGTMAWPPTRLVRSASMSSTGSGEAEESEVRDTHVRSTNRLLRSATLTVKCKQVVSRYLSEAGLRGYTLEVQTGEARLSSFPRLLPNVLTRRR